MATKRTLGQSVTSTPVTLYTVPDHRQSEWVLLYATNTGGSTADLSVDFTDSSESVTLPVFDGYTVSAKDYLQIGGRFNEFIMMEEGDSITASSTGTMSVLVSVIEHNSNR